MYNKDDLIVYGTAGVYKVENITKLSGVSYADSKKEYYVLKPLFSEGVVYYPVDSNKIFTRKIISKEEVDSIIDLIPKMQSEAVMGVSVAELAERYKTLQNSHNCEDLIELLMSIYQKRQIVKEQNKRLGQIDEVYFKETENLLYSEFAAALKIEKNEVENYIQNRLNNGENQA